MSISVPSRYKLGPARNIRAGEPIVGVSGDEVYELVQNAHYNYAHRWDCIVNEGGLVDIADFQEAGTSYVVVLNPWVALAEDCQNVAWVAEADDCDVRVQIYDDVAATSLLDSSTQTATGVAEVSDSYAGLGQTGNILVRVAIRYRGAGGAPGKMYNFRLYQDTMTVAQLPT